MKHELHEWTVSEDVDTFRAPECSQRFLTGRPHPPRKCHHAADTRVTTSYIVSAKGREVTTESGTVYVLREPDADYAAWCAGRGTPIDPENPIRIRGRVA